MKRNERSENTETALRYITRLARRQLHFSINDVRPFLPECSDTEITSAFRIAVRDDTLFVEGTEPSKVKSHHGRKVSVYASNVYQMKRNY